MSAININKNNNFQNEVLNSDKPVLLDFNGLLISWCAIAAW